MKIRGKKVGSWSLPAGISCPGSKDAPVCGSCYAKKGMYRFPSVKNVREYNREDYHKDDWVDRMVKEVSKYDYFRWFDSGDVETPKLASRIRDIIHATPSTHHWLPTRSDKITSIATEFAGRFYSGTAGSFISFRQLTNLNLRPSADHIGLNNNERPGVNSYVILPEDMFEAKKQGIQLCPVSVPGSTQKSCDYCTICYTDAKVAYILH